MSGSQPNQSLVGRTIQSAGASTSIAYKVTEWLRSSSVLDTYVAVHGAVGLKIELQVILPVLTAQSDFLGRFATQLKTLVALNVPSLAQVYDYGRDGGYFFIVIEHRKSPTLRVKLDSDGRLPLPIALNNARLIAETLGYTSAQGVLHGLLAPEVVTLSNRRGPLLDHFGLTPLLGPLLMRILANDSQLGGYAAPELFDGQPVSTASDLYSLTALTYEMATGSPPYAGLSARQAAAASIPDPAQFDPALSVLTPFIRRGLAKDPAARFLSYRDFNTAIQEILGPMEPIAPSAKQSIDQLSARPSPRPAPLAKTETVEEHAGGRTIADMPVASSAPSADPKTVQENFSGRTRLEPSDSILDTPTIPRQVEQRYRAEADSDDTSATMSYDFSSVTATHEDTQHGTFRDRYGTRQMHQTDLVVFSAFYPRTIEAEMRTGLFVYAHLEAALELIVRDVAKFREAFGGSVPLPKSAKRDITLAPGTMVTVVPECDELEFNPPLLRKRWEPDWVRYEFDFRARKALVGETAIVNLSIQVEGIEFASIKKCAIEVVRKKVEAPTALWVEHKPVARVNIPFRNQLAQAKAEFQARMEHQAAVPYQRIFVSYSRKDTDVVRAYKAAQEAIGNDVFVDTEKMHTGEDWMARLALEIDKADVLQLFWSTNSAASHFVYEEWEYALLHKCPEEKCFGFIRPVYWNSEKPNPEPPKELAHLHFRRVDFETTRPFLIRVITRLAIFMRLVPRNR